MDVVDIIQKKFVATIFVANGIRKILKNGKNI